METQYLQKEILGLRPRYLWLEERTEEIKSAMARYMRKNKQVPICWLKEYNLLAKELVKLKKNQ